MSLALILAMQAATPAQAAATPLPLAPIDFDLARHRPSEPGLTGRGCRADDPAPIMVCARRPSGGAYPMDQWERIFAPRPLRAERDLGGGTTLGFHAEAVEIAPGMVSNRVMIGLRMPF